MDMLFLQPLDNLSHYRKTVRSEYQFINMHVYSVQYGAELYPSMHDISTLFLWQKDVGFMQICYRRYRGEQHVVLIRGIYISINLPQIQEHMQTFNHCIFFAFEMFTCFIFLSPGCIYGATDNVYPDVLVNLHLYGFFFPHKLVFCISVFILSFSSEVK